MAEDVLKASMRVFNSVNDQFLTLAGIVQHVQCLVLYRNIESHEADARWEIDIASSRRFELWINLDALPVIDTVAEIISRAEAKQRE